VQRYFNMPVLPARSVKIETPMASGRHGNNLFLYSVGYGIFP
jgi:hypothetical protein